jgi:Fur family ferric uptake transcriptional regulator
MRSGGRPDEEFRELLVSKKIRVTEQRLALLREMAKVKSPISHPELTERMTGSGLDRATVYRNLLLLAESGVLVRAELGDHVWRYELPRIKSSDHGHHPHLVCEDCGNVRCLPAGTIKISGEAAKNEISEVQLRGRCASCLAAAC